MFKSVKRRISMALIAICLPILNSSSVLSLKRSNSEPNFRLYFMDSVQALEQSIVSKTKESNMEIIQNAINNYKPLLAPEEHYLYKNNNKVLANTKVVKLKLPKLIRNFANLVKYPKLLKQKVYSLAKYENGKEPVYCTKGLRNKIENYEMDKLTIILKQLDNIFSGKLKLAEFKVCGELNEYSYFYLESGKKIGLAFSGKGNNVIRIQGNEENNTQFNWTFEKINDNV